MICKNLQGILCLLFQEKGKFLKSYSCFFTSSVGKRWVISMRLMQNIILKLVFCKENDFTTIEQYLVFFNIVHENIFNYFFSSLQEHPDFFSIFFSLVNNVQE